jgi:signal transduction histidine kinase
VKTQETAIDRVALLRLAVALWLGYLFVLAVIDHTLYPHPVFPPHYYLINSLDALAVLGLALWRQGQRRLGGAFLPLVIALISLIPVVTSNTAVLGVPPGPSNRPEVLMLRTLPILFVALILTAWQYGWPIVVGFSVGVNLFALGLHLFFYRLGPVSLLPPVVVLLIQTVSFLVVGYFIHTLMTRMEQQRRALERANTRLLDYAGTLEDLATSRERNRLARELHDTLAHTLSGLSVQLETAKAYWDVDPATAQRLLAQSLAATRAGLQETRRALNALRSSPLEDLGLRLAVRQLAESAAERADLHLDLALPASLPALSDAEEQCVYRIAQEAVANVVHHANARTLTVHLARENHGIRLTVGDDGQGFEPHHLETAGHYGLKGMHERAALSGGTLTVESRSGAGTEVQLRI